MPKNERRSVHTCLNQPLEEPELAGVKRRRGAFKKIVEGMEFVLTTTFLWKVSSVCTRCFYKRGRSETTFIVLRKFGYYDDMRQKLDGMAKIVFDDDQSIELTQEARASLPNATHQKENHC